MAPLLEAERLRWETVSESLPSQDLELLQIKWNLPPDFAGGNLPRPRSLEETADFYSSTKEEVIEWDWRLIDQMRRLRLRNRFFDFQLFYVPIQDAQAWWDRRQAWLYWPDGTPKSEAHRESPPKDIHAEDAHEIADRQELREHMESVHGCDYSVWQLDLIAIYHRVLHVEEAEDRDWDQRLRPSGTPPVSALLPDLDRPGSPHERPLGEDPGEAPGRA